MIIRMSAIVMAVFLSAAPPVAAGERYYVLIFGSQRVPPNPDYAHSFATFVRVRDCAGDCFIRHHTISWLPVSGVVRVRKLFPEKGRNYELHETMRWALRSKQRISMWGPHEISRAIYEKSARQHKIVEKQQVWYCAVDYYLPNFYACNCIHAVSGVCSFSRLRVWVPSFGETASYLIARRFRWWMIDPDKRHPWVASALDLQQYPIICRRWQAPRSGAVWTLLRVLTGKRAPRTSSPYTSNSRWSK